MYCVFGSAGIIRLRTRDPVCVIARSISRFGSVPEQIGLGTVLDPPPLAFHRGIGSAKPDAAAAAICNQLRDESIFVGGSDGRQLTVDAIDPGRLGVCSSYRLVKRTGDDFVELFSLGVVAQFRVGGQQRCNLCFAIGVDAADLADDGAVDLVFVDIESQRCFAGGEATFVDVADGQVVATDGIRHNSIAGKLIEPPVRDQACFVIRQVAAMAGRNFVCRSRIAKQSCIKKYCLMSHADIEFAVGSVLFVAKHEHAAAGNGVAGGQSVA